MGARRGRAKRAPLLVGVLGVALLLGEVGRRVRPLARPDEREAADALPTLQAELLQSRRHASRTSNTALR